MSKKNQLLLLFVFFYVSCSMNLTKRSPAQIDDKEKIQAFRQCFKELSDLSSGEQVGRHPWGKTGAYIVGVPGKFIPGAEELYLEYRYKPSSPQRDAALSATYLFISDQEVKSFVVPNFSSDINYDPMGRIKIGDEYYYYLIDIVGDPTCFYDNLGKNINPYIKLKDSQCPAFTKQQFLTHNKKVLKNPLMKVDAKKEHYTELKATTPEDQLWVEPALENAVKGVFEDAISSYSGHWAKAVYEAKNSDKVIPAPDGSALTATLESSSCKEFEVTSTGLERMKKIEDAKRDDLNYYNQK